jgi:hypothetical protein
MIKTSCDDIIKQIKNESQKTNRFEFVGPPAAGKTYSAELLEKQTFVTLARVNTRAEKYFLLIMFTLKHPIIFLLFLYLLTKNSNSINLFYHKIFGILLPAIALEEKSSKVDNFVLDQGLIQVLIGSYDTCVNKETIQKDWKLVSNFFHKRKIVLFCISEDEQMMRMQKRKRIPRQKFGIEYAKAFTVVFRSNYESFKKVAFLDKRNDFYIIV